MTNGHSPLTFFDLPLELQLMVLRGLKAEELVVSMLTSKQFYRLAMDDSLWKSLIDKADLPESVLTKARLTCGCHASWHAILRSATIIMRENERVLQDTLLKMKAKVEQVRRALDRQTRVLEETNWRLMVLGGKLSRMEHRGRQREQERLREMIFQAQQLEDERWFSEWAASDEVRKLELDQINWSDVDEWMRQQ